MKKRTIKLFPILGFLTTFCLFLVMQATAQTGSDSATVSTLIGTGIVADSWKPYIYAALGIYEIVARLIPSAKNFSISGFLIKVYQTLVPNRNSKVPSVPHP